MNVILQHPAIFSIAAYWAFSAFTGGMPLPKETSSDAYTWLYNSLHILAGNISTAVAAKYPQLPSGSTQQVTGTTTTTIKVP
jgi:hypothetical protein